MNTDYPLIFFSARGPQDLQKYTSGPQKDPSYVLKGDRLKQHAERLSHEFGAICDMATERFTRRKSGIPLVFKAKIGTDHTSKTKRREIAPLFSDGRIQALIGMNGTDELLVQLVSPEHAKAVSQHLSSPADCARGISLIDSIAPFSPEIAQSLDSCSRYKVRLIDFHDQAVNDKARKLAEEIMGADGARRDYVHNHSLYSLTGSRRKAIRDQLIAEGLVRSVTEMPVYRAEPDAVGTPSSVDILPRDPSGKYPRLGILDSGIAVCDALAPWICGKSHPNYGPELVDPRHGTLVAGTAIYGDLLEGKNWTGVNGGIDLFDATVMPGHGEAIYEDELIANIREALDEHHGEAAVWNLSVSIAREISRDSFSDFAIFLDDIQKQYGIIICKSAGNTLRFRPGETAERLNAGAESLLALTVGSIAHEKGPCDLAEIGERSPFSCVGPGLESATKPELVHFGGNAGFDSDGNPVFTGVKSVNADGAVQRVPGTSFATPRVAALAAGLVHELGDRANSLLVKALLVHSAFYPNANERMPLEDRRRERGYGLPRPLNEILTANPDESTLIICDRLPRKRFLDIIDFPMADILLNDGLYDFTADVTLAVDPILESSEGLEYCQTDMDLEFGCYSDKIHHDTRKRGHPNPVTVKNVRNICNESSIFSKRAWEKMGPHRTERALIAEKMKYCPLKHFTAETRLFRPAFLKELSDRRKWYLKLMPHFRLCAGNRIDANENLGAVDFCLILTVRDPRKQGRLYDRMCQHLRNEQFALTPLHLTSESRIAITG